MYVRADGTVEEEVVAAVEATAERWGRVDGLVCNAAAMELTRLDGPVSEIALETWNRILLADLTSVFLTVKHGLRAMLDGGGGSVVLISSMAATRGLNGLDAYTAAKGGILAMTRSIASYYARYDIRCNCLVVGFVDSGSSVIGESAGPPEQDERLWAHTLGRLGRPEDIATVAAHLLSDDAGYVSGGVIPVDGGATAASHLPRPSVGDIPGRSRRRPRAPLF
jgi:NAD(P)-dependent dehydrogenase (short-subunit alcohol dehydrogenase family)